MKVAFITHYTSLYGANRSLLNLIQGLQTYNVTPYVIVPAEGNITDALQAINVEFLVIPFQWWLGWRVLEGNWLKKSFQVAQYQYQAVKRLLKNLLLLKTLGKQLNTWDIDIVYTNSSVTPIGAFVSQKLGLPHIWHLREFIDLDYNLNFDWGRFIFDYFVSRANVKIAISQAIYSHLIKKFSDKNTKIIYNGVASIAQFDFYYKYKSLSPHTDLPYTFVLVGGINPNKGQNIAIEALALLAKDFPKTRLLIVGEGEEGSISQLKKLADNLNILDKVEFWGYTDDPYQAYLIADAALMCSKNEGMGRVTVEAMSACCPVIGYDNGGTAEIIEHEHTGLLYRGKAESLAANMKRFIENPTWAKKLGENAWHKARKEYSIECYTQKVYEALLSVTNESKCSIDSIKRQAYSEV